MGKNGEKNPGRWVANRDGWLSSKEGGLAKSREIGYVQRDEWLSPGRWVTKSREIGGYVHGWVAKSRDMAG